MTVERDSHCSWCGAEFPEGLGWPRQCVECGQMSYKNPLPVAVGLVPVGDQGLLMVRRDIDPGKGALALPGGFIEIGESWQEACAREVFEETQLQLDPDSIEDFCVLSAPDGTVLIFGLAEAVDPADVPEFEPTPEASERVVLAELTEELAFPLHTDAARLWFEEHS